MQDILHNQDNQGADGSRANLDRAQQAKAESQNDQEIGVAPGDHLVDGELQVERTSNHKDLEDSREDQDLYERVSAAVQLRPEGRKWKPCSLILGPKTFRRRELKRDTGQMLRRLSDRKESLA